MNSLIALTAHSLIHSLRSVLQDMGDEPKGVPAGKTKQPCLPLSLMAGISTLWTESTHDPESTVSHVSLLSEE